MFSVISSDGFMFKFKNLAETIACTLGKQCPVIPGPWRLIIDTLLYTWCIVV